MVIARRGRHQTLAVAVCGVLAVGAVALGASQRGAGPGALPPPVLTPGTGVILGRVIDGDSGEAITDATVTISGAALGPTGGVFTDGTTAGSRSIASDAQGTLLFYRLPKGTYQISVTASGYFDGGYGETRPPAAIGRVLDINRSIDLGDAEKLSDIVIRLWKRGSISGTVVDEAGEPMVSVVVSLVACVKTWGGLLLARGGTGSTDDRGIYKVDVLPGDYFVAVLAAPTTMPTAAIDDYFEARGPTTALQMQSIRAYAAAAVAAGRPISPPPMGIRVGDFAVSAGLAGGPTGPKPLPARVEGGRLFLYPTTYYRTGRSPAAATPVTVRSGEKKTGIDLQLRPERSLQVSGMVTGPTGPVPNAGVRLILPDQVSHSSPAVVIDPIQSQTDAGGHFTFFGVPPGQYTLRVLLTPVTLSAGRRGLDNSSADPPAQQEPTLWAFDPLTVDDRDVTDVRVALHTGARFTGHVEYAGAGTPPAVRSPIVITARPMPGTLPADVNGSSNVTQTDASDRFMTSQLPAGQYLLAMSGIPSGWALRSAIAGDRDASDVLVDLGASDIDVVLTLTDRVSKVTGTVRDSNGQPSASSVVIFAADSRFWPRVGLGSRRQRTLSTGRTGVFTVSGLPAGDYYIAAVASSTTADFSDPKVMTSLMTVGTKLSLTDGDSKTSDLKIVEIK